jgi:hypothetical protein
MAKKTIMEKPRNKFLVIGAGGAEKPVGAVPPCHHPAWSRMIVLNPVSRSSYL